jgi:uncharacterized protein
VSKELPSREQALKLLTDAGCSAKVVSHCLAVTELALQIASKLKANGYQIDLRTVEAGAILHDIGRSKTHGVEHSVVGAQIAHKVGLPPSVANIIKRHVGAGITGQEAASLGWPKDIYVPQTLEEKVVCYADKRIEHDKVVPIETEIQKLESGGFTEAAERVRNLHNVITQMLGEPN